ncbi:unnamed protein product [Trichogramma brassicae]|uniref:Uncharacterized protein n=1 Tax=Trichogramma brassicae TaxID=86971 RepID=A0A6H5I132_9HYME|nr:unnamed protein product [Trichogramma brassicae]
MTDSLLSPITSTASSSRLDRLMPSQLEDYRGGDENKTKYNENQRHPGNFFCRRKYLQHENHKSSLGSYRPTAGESSGASWHPAPIRISNNVAWRAAGRHPSLKWLVGGSNPSATLNFWTSDELKRAASPNRRTVQAKTAIQQQRQAKRGPFSKSLTIILIFGNIIIFFLRDMTIFTAFIVRRFIVYLANYESTSTTPWHGCGSGRTGRREFEKSPDVPWRGYPNLTDQDSPVIRHCTRLWPTTILRWPGAAEKRGANPNLINEEGKTPLHIICKQRASRQEELLAIFPRLAQLDVMDTLGRTPLRWGRGNLVPRVVNILLDHGAGPVSLRFFPTAE